MDQLTLLPPGGPYQKMYLALFNAVTDALSMLENDNFGDAAQRLRAAQREAEEQYLTYGE